MAELLRFELFTQRRHALLQLLNREFEGRRAGDPDQVMRFTGALKMVPVNFAHAAAEFIADGGGAEPLGREEGDMAGFAGRRGVAREKVEGEPAVVDAAAFCARGVEDDAPPDDAGAGKGFGGGNDGKLPAEPGRDNPSTSLRDVEGEVRNARSATWERGAKAGIPTRKHEANERHEESKAFSLFHVLHSLHVFRSNRSATATEEA